MIYDDPAASRLFLLGKTTVSSEALSRTTSYERRTFYLRHQIGSWEQTPQAIRRSSWLALFHPLPVVSYHKGERGMVVLITDADRSRTRMMSLEEIKA